APPSDLQIRPVELTRCRDAEIGQSVVDLPAEELQDVPHAGLAGSEVGPDVGATQHDRARAQGKGADDIDAAAHAAVEQNLDVAAHGIDDIGQRAKRWHAPVQV